MGDTHPLPTAASLNFAGYLRKRGAFNGNLFFGRGQKLRLTHDWAVAVKIAKKGWCKEDTNEQLEVLASALEGIQEDYKGTLGSLGELLDIYIYGTLDEANSVFPTSGSVDDRRRDTLTHSALVKNLNFDVYVSDSAICGGFLDGQYFTLSHDWKVAVRIASKWGGGKQRE